MEDGTTIAAETVVAAPGIAHFAVVPPLVRDHLSPEQWSHTSTTVDFTALKGRRCLIVGGRQSAFEWAALLNEEGAARVDVVHRHDTPEFTASDWSFVDDLLARTRETRGWFRRLPELEREAVAQRFWQVGRLQLEPWLADRIAGDTVRLWPHAEPARIDHGPGDAITVTLSDGTRLETDHVLLATGYRVDMRRVPYLAATGLDLADGFPVLDEDFQTSVPGLYIPGFPSTRDFGPFFGFVAGATTTAAIIGAALARIPSSPS
jgi:thioredoxin reductase